MIDINARIRDMDDPRFPCKVYCGFGIYPPVSYTHLHEFVIKDIPRPDAGPKQVIIKTLACSICNATDNHILEGIFDGYQN